MVTVVFSNAEARPHNVTVECTVASIPQIMAWYGSYYAGDRYTVTVDGRDVRMDLNGEPIEGALS